MIKKHSKGSLVNQIAGVLSAVPTQFDPEDEDLDNTRARLADFDDFDEEDDNDEDLLSSFRRQNIGLLSDVDRRYAGKKGHRSLQEDSSAESSELETSEEEEAIEENDEVDSDGIEESGSDESISDNEKTSAESESEVRSVASSEADEPNFQHMSETKVSEQVKKGICVRNQMNIWESLLEMRIQMQKCLVASNKMPQKENYRDMLVDTDFKKKLKETQESLSSVLDKLLTLQNRVIRKYPETKRLGKKSQAKVGKGNESDEEIPGDSDEEEVEESDEGSDEDMQIQKSKRRKLNDYEDDIVDLHSKYMPYRNDTIEKWNTKTRLSVTKNAGQTHSVISQIEHILNDRDKLRKRTQLKRSEYNILGQDDNMTETLESTEDVGDVKQAEEYNTEIFDDSDFYHQLLRELIEVKSADITDPVQLGRQWIQLQNLRSKMKRKIDTRATKGRKIRYAVHTKLVNFMAPLDRQRWTEEAKDELYSSLFGKVQPK